MFSPTASGKTTNKFVNKFIPLVASFSYFPSCPCLSLVYLVQVTCSCSAVVTHKCISLSLSFCLIWSYERKWLTVNLYCLKNVICRKVVPAAAAIIFLKAVFRASILFPLSIQTSETKLAKLSLLLQILAPLFWRVGVGVSLSSSNSSTRTSSQVSWTTLCCVSECECVSIYIGVHFKVSSLNSLIGVCRFVWGREFECLFFSFLLLECGIVSILYFWECGWTRNLFEENERKMKACSFFWLLQGTLRGYLKLKSNNVLMFKPQAKN